jgi:hypothetical protein
MIKIEIFICIRFVGAVIIVVYRLSSIFTTFKSVNQIKMNL